MAKKSSKAKGSNEEAVTKKKVSKKKAASKKVSSKKVAKKKAAAKKKVAKKKAAGKKTVSRKVTSKKVIAPAGARNPIQITAEERWRMIATAAYYKAEARAFAHGNEQQDWLDAEREIDKLLSSSK